VVTGSSSNFLLCGGVDIPANCWDLVTTNSSKDGFGSYYSALVATK